MQQQQQQQQQQGPSPHMANNSIISDNHHAHLFSFSGANKAGMDNIDKEKQASIIYEMSKNSEYFKRAQQQDEKTQIKVNQMQQKIHNMTATQKVHCQQIIQKKLIDHEKKRDLNKICCVLDMDMFYAAVEIRDHPEYKDQPVAVGGMSMISTTNYIARKYGVRSAMPGFIGKKLCPSLIFIEPNFDKYERVGRQIRNIIAEYDPHFETMSLDEVYFDLTASVLKYMRSNGENTKRNDDKGDMNNSNRDMNDTGMNGTQINNEDSNQQSSDLCKIYGNCHSDNDEDSHDDNNNDIDDCRSVAIYDSINIHSIDSSSSTNDNSIFVSTSAISTSSSSSSSSSSLLHNNIDNSPTTQQKSKRTNINTPTNSSSNTSNNSNHHHSFSILQQRQVADSILHEIRQRIFTVTNGLTCSAGLANNFMLAKICADINKPNGQFQLPVCKSEILKFMHQLQTRKLGGVGKVTEQILKCMGMTTMGEVYQNLEKIVFAFTPAIAEFLIRASIGIGNDEDGRNSTNNNTAVVEPYQRKSLGTERTFSSQISSFSTLKSKLQEICQAVSDDLISQQLYAQTVTLKLKTIKFELITRSITVNTSSNTSNNNNNSYKGGLQKAEDIYKLAVAVLEKEMPITIRLMGVTMSKFIHNSSSNNNSDLNSMMKQFFVKSGSNNNASNIYNDAKDDCDNNDDEDDDDNDVEVLSPSAVATYHNNNHFHNQSIVDSKVIANDTINISTIGNENIGENIINVKKDTTSDKLLNYRGIDYVPKNSTTTSSIITDTNSNSSSSTILQQQHQQRCPVCTKSIIGGALTFSMHVDSCLTAENSHTSQSSLLSKVTAAKSTINGYYQPNKSNTTITMNTTDVRKRQKLQDNATTTKNMVKSKLTSYNENNTHKHITDYSDNDVIVIDDDD